MKKHWLLLQAMIVKELRMTLRERQQKWSLLIALVALVGVSIALSQKLRPGLQTLRAQAAATQPAGTQPATGSAKELLAYVDPMVIRWVCIGLGTAVSLFFAMGHVVSATLASFAGEKDTKTLEVLLASPIGDTNLFITKCLSVLLPTWVIGYIMLLVPAGVSLVLLRQELAQSPINVAFYVLVLSLPVVVLMEASTVAIGAAISVKAETLKGATQAFGGIFFVIFFGLGYGLPLLISFTRLRGPAIAFGKAWISMPFAVQYAILLVGLGMSALVSLLIGRSLFRRDRLLT